MSLRPGPGGPSLNYKIIMYSNNLYCGKLTFIKNSNYCVAWY